MTRMPSDFNLLAFESQPLSGSLAILEIAKDPSLALVIQIQSLSLIKALIGAYGLNMTIESR